MNDSALIMIEFCEITEKVPSFSNFNEHSL